MTGLTIESKRQFHPWRWLLMIILIGLVAAVGWYGYRWYTTGEEPPLPIPIASADSRIDESSLSQAKVNNYTVPATEPRYISIPALKLSMARVMQVGITTDGQLDVPKNINDTAWFKDSATPGSGVGAVLIDGHNGGRTKQGVFAKLSTLQTGDRITIERGDGKKFTYKVVENKSMALEEVNATGMRKMTQSIESDKEGLSVITTDGKWVPRYKQFDRRIMLRAVIVE